MNTIYELGYRFGDSKHYLDRLLQQDKTILIDARYKPEKGNPVWFQSALIQHYGDKYHWAECLGNEHYWMKQPAPIKIHNLALGLKGLSMYLNEGYDLVVMCACADYLACHRKFVLDALAQMQTYQLVTYTPKENIFRAPVVAPVVVEQSALFDVPSEHRHTMYQ